MPPQPFSDGRFEAHDADRTGIGLELIRDCSRHLGGIASPAFHLDQDRNTARNQVEQLAHPGNMLPAIEQLLAGKDRRWCGFDRQRRCAQSPQIMVVEHHDLAVARQANVAFDARADFQRGTEGCKAIFGNAGAMESAMREPHYPWVERVRL